MCVFKTGFQEIKQLLAVPKEEKHEETSKMEKRIEWENPKEERMSFKDVEGQGMITFGQKRI